MTTLAIALLLVGAYFVGQALARTPKPVPIPASLAKTRASCPHFAYQQGTDNLALTARIVESCLRGRLREAYQAVEWQRGENLKLARQMLGKLTDWTCIHNGRKHGKRVGSGEGSWTANTGNGYHGGLQMDWPFMRTYGRDMLAKHHGRGAEAWTPREQIIVAQRAFAQGRGYNPWPNTGRACGLVA